MIWSPSRPLSGVQAAPHHSFNAKPLVSTCRAPQHASAHVSAAVQSVFAGSSSNSSRPCSSLVVCRAEPDPVSGYTPADYISFSDEPNKQCHHNVEAMVDAPLDLCYSLWSDWTKQLDFLDLVGQIGLDSGNPHMALFQCFYRYRKLPLMEVVFLLEREEFSADGVRGFYFKSVYGMPIKGQLQLGEQSDGQTLVRLYFTHPVPNLLVQLQIGPFGVETDLIRILRENLAAYKTQVEAAVPADWQERKQQVAEKVQAVAREQIELQQQQWQQRQEQQQQAAEQQQVGEQPSPQQPAAASQQQQQRQDDKQQQQEQQQQPKRPRGRSTASKASSAPAAAAAAPEAAEAAPAAPARGRKTTRGRTASKAAAAGDSSSTIGRRRTTKASSSSEAAAAADASNGNGTAPAAPSSSSGTPGKAGGRRSPTTRRTSKRSSTAANEGA